MRIPLIAGNWKMNCTVPEALVLAAGIARSPDLAEAGDAVEVVLCPPLTCLAAVAQLLAGSRVAVGAQNGYFLPKGAYTGEVSMQMLSGLVKYVIVGHSERRQHFGETDDAVAAKASAAVEAGLTPIICVGEGWADREAGRTVEVVRTQLSRVLDKGMVGEFVVAYEPVWAIGTGRAATGPMAQEVLKLLRDTIAQHTTGQTAEATRILYGGSVNANNIEEFVSQPDVDGPLLGGASLNVNDFVSIVATTYRVRAGAR